MVVERKGKEIKACCRGRKGERKFQKQMLVGEREGKGQSYMERRESEKANINRMGWKVGGRKPKESACVVSLP
jgi:hypothetical protein